MKGPVRSSMLIAALFAFDCASAADDDRYAFVQADRLEYSDSEHASVWDLQGWVGDDYNKLWIKAEGKYAERTVEESEIQLLFSRAWTPFFDLQIGFRLDQEPQPTRSYLALGMQGLAPHWFEIDAAVFLSDHGELSASLEAEYDLLLTQRLVLQPRLEFEVSAEDVPERGIGSGITETEFGLRLRYEWHRKVAPYLGINWSRLNGKTADRARALGTDTEDTSFVIGIRLWY